MRGAVICAGVLAALACSTPASRDGGGSGFDVQGHRGARGLLPENTLPAFRRAIELGVTTLELDVGVTRDGVVVVSHDPAVSPRVCQHPDGTPMLGGHSPLLRDLTLRELHRYDCGSLPPNPRRFPSPPWQARPGERIPTLVQVLELARLDRELRFNVETKLRPGDEETIPAPLFVEAVLEVVREHGLERRVAIQSFDWRALRAVRRLAPEIETVGLLAPDTLEPRWLGGLTPDPEDPLALYRQARAFLDAVSPHFVMVLPEGGRGLPVERIRALGLAVVPWTVNDEDTMQRLLDLGVDGIITDYPDVLLQVLADRGVRVR